MAEIQRSPCNTRYSSEADSDEERKKKRLRRKRGGARHRPNSTSPVSKDDNVEALDRGEIDRVAMAPSNTTQFLVEDLEARIGDQQSAEKSKVSENGKRTNGCLGSSDPGSSSEDSLLGEFETSYLDVKRQRIEQMSKLEKMARVYKSLITTNRPLNGKLQQS